MAVRNPVTTAIVRQASRQYVAAAPRASTLICTSQSQHRVQCSSPTSQRSREAVTGLRWKSARNFLSPGPLPSPQRDPRFLRSNRRWDFKTMKEIAADPGSEIIIIDVREPAELIETGKIPGAINIPIVTAPQSFHIPPDDFRTLFKFKRPSKTKKLLFYCKAGVRAESAANLAHMAGWRETAVYPGSWLDWMDRGGEVEKIEQMSAEEVLAEQEKERLYEAKKSSSAGPETEVGVDDEEMDAGEARVREDKNKLGNETEEVWGQARQERGDQQSSGSLRGLGSTSRKN